MGRKQLQSYLSEAAVLWDRHVCSFCWQTVHPATVRMTTGACWSGRQTAKCPMPCVRNGYLHIKCLKTAESLIQAIDEECFRKEKKLLLFLKWCQLYCRAVLIQSYIDAVCIFLTTCFDLTSFLDAKNLNALIVKLPLTCESFVLASNLFKMLKLIMIH